MENANQFYDLTAAEMLEMYKTLTHLSAVRRECVVERDDGIDLDRWLSLRLEQWYARLLFTAPVEWLPVEDVSAQVTLTSDSWGVVTATVPRHCVRPVEWRLQGWCRSVTDFLAPNDPLVRLQLNPFTRGRAGNPAATDHLVLYSVAAGATPTLDLARCVVRPADGRYRFHAAALETLPPLDMQPA